MGSPPENAGEQSERSQSAWFFLWCPLRILLPHFDGLDSSCTCFVCCMKPSWGRASCLSVLLGFSYLLSLMCLSPVCSPTTQGLFQLLSDGGCGWRPCLGGRFCFLGLGMLKSQAICRVLLCVILGGAGS